MLADWSNSSVQRRRLKNGRFDPPSLDAKSGAVSPKFVDLSARVRFPVLEGRAMVLGLSSLVLEDVSNDTSNGEASPSFEVLSVVAPSFDIV